MFARTLDTRVAWDSHPEFGILCPSPSRFRRMRFGLACALAGLAIGATIELAIAHRGAPDPGSAAANAAGQGASLAEGGHAAETSAPSLAMLPPISGAAAAVSPSVSPQASCDGADAGDPRSAFLNPACGASRPHARHAGRGNRRPTMIGHAEMAAVPGAGEQVSASQPKVEASQPVADAAAAKVAPASSRTVSASKKRVVPSDPVALAPADHPATRQAEGYDAFAWTRPARGPFDNATRVPASRSWTATPFGGMW
jgi:hypothetical protein